MREGGKDRRGARGDSATHHKDSKGQVVLALEGKDGVLLEVCIVHLAVLGLVSLGQHPANVGVPEALDDAIGVLVSVHVLVVRAVAARPPLYAALHCSCAHEHEQGLKEWRGLEGPVRKVAVVACKVGRGWVWGWGE